MLSGVPVFCIGSWTRLSLYSIQTLENARYNTKWTLEGANIWKTLSIQASKNSPFVKYAWTNNVEFKNIEETDKINVLRKISEEMFVYRERNCTLQNLTRLERRMNRTHTFAEDRRSSEKKPETSRYRRKS